MKFKIFIVTYKNPDRLSSCLDALAKSDIRDYDHEIYVLNNHDKIPEIDIGEGISIRVLNNESRPDFSTGHLSRSWNQAIIRGFKDLESPDCEHVVTIQDDVEVAPQGFSKLLQYHEKYNFISVGTGDDFMSFTPESVMTVGLFDERFCNIGFQHEEYFIRQVAFNRNKSSINDFYHNCLHNQLYLSRGKAIPVAKADDSYVYYNGLNDIIKFKTCGYLNGDEGHMASLRYHSYVSEFMRSKWEFKDLDLLNMYTRDACFGEMSFLKNKMYTSKTFRARGVGKEAYSPFTSGPFDDWLGDPDGNIDKILSTEDGLTCLDPQPIFYPEFESKIKNRKRVGYAI